MPIQPGGLEGSAVLQEGSKKALVKAHRIYGTAWDPGSQLRARKKVRGSIHVNTGSLEKQARLPGILPPTGKPFSSLKWDL